jgi:hypothetical protein
LEGEGKGREALYVKGQHDSKLHTRLAAGDMPLAPAGTRMALVPDSLLVRSASRHSITDAGIGSLIDHFGRVVTSAAKADPRQTTVGYLGALQRPEFNRPLEGVEQIILPGAEKDFPRGGRRWWFFDPALRLPVLVLAQDDRRQEVEYYCHDRFEFNVKLDDADFDPDKLWGKP